MKFPTKSKPVCCFRGTLEVNEVYTFSQPAVATYNNDSQEHPKKNYEHET